ncbi:MAG: ATP-binding protein [Burkholderiaceae bacterium]
MRIRSRLLILVVSLLLPFLVGAVLGIYYIYEKQHTSYRESIRDLSRAMALLLDKEMAARVRTLQTLAASPMIADNNFQGFYRFADQVASNWHNVVVLTDLSGQQFLNTRTPYGTKDLPRSNPELLSLRKKIGPKATLISDVYFAPIGKSHSFAVQVPVERDGQVQYYLSMGAFTSRLQRLLQEQKLPSGWIATILDRKGVVAARTHEPEKFVGAIADAGLRRKIAAETEGTNDGSTLDGIPVTAFFSRAPQSEWTIVVSVPQEALNGPALQATMLVSVIALLLLGGGAAAAILIARKTARPMEELRQVAVEMGKGELVARPSSGVLEIDAVSMEMARASEQIRSARAELENRVADAVAAAERSQKALLQSQKLEALGRLTGGIAHDFNNVMQTLTTGLQVALYSVTEPRVTRALEACQRAVERAADLTRQLMAFGRVQDAHLETLDLARHIEDVRPLLKGALRSDIEMLVDIVDDPWPVTVDPMQLELALLNVTINAAHAMQTGGLLKIQVRNTVVEEAGSELAAGDYVQLVVSDSGHGMTPEVLSKALDPFFTTKAVGQGPGLGLPQAYGLAKQMGGTLILESHLGRGTSISFYLPRAKTPLSGKTPMQPQASARMAKPGSRLLFVEDDALVSAVVVPALRLAGFDVHEAANGEDALELFMNKGPFDAVFSDIVMPGRISGIDLATQILQKHPDARVVLATGYSERRVTLPGVEILAKPYKVADILELLSAART